MTMTAEDRALEREGLELVVAELAEQEADFTRPCKNTGETDLHHARKCRLARERIERWLRRRR